MDLSLYVQIAQTAERGLFDALFVGDNVCLNDWLTGLDAASRIGNTIGFEPFTLLGGLAMVTRHIGLMATASTSYNHPYHIARKFASLDHMTGGRAGWNVVTSNNVNEAANFGADTLSESADRYVVANEFVDVVKALWDSWADDAFIRDRRSGEYYDLAKLRMGRHVGAHFEVAGPLNVSRTPQGRPVLCQAGRSQAGMDLAARTADLIFNNQHSADASRAFRQQMRARAVGHGRSADDIRFMAGVFVVVGGTEEEAQRKMRDARDAVDTPTAKRFLQPFLPSLDLEALDFDSPLPVDDTVLASAKAAGMALEERGRRLSMRELCTSYGNHWRQLQVVGAAEQVADLMCDWFARDAADGFNVFTLGMPGGFEDFVDGVVPELQRRGVYRTAYEGKTLREHLGIARPALV
jgi:FMN-dependent oxidoreductase (nitrilotriacetate monooxygenase family)